MNDTVGVSSGGLGLGGLVEMMDVFGGTCRGVIVLWPRPLFSSEWEMIPVKGFFAVLYCLGPLLTGTTGCVRHIHVYRLEFKMAAIAHTAAILIF